MPSSLEVHHARSAGSFDVNEADSRVSQTAEQFIRFPNEISSINLEWERVRTAIFLEALVSFDAFSPQGDTRNVTSRDCGYSSLRKQHVRGRRKIYEKTHFSDSDSFIIS